jgi:hypothetical protein
MDFQFALQSFIAAIHNDPLLSGLTVLVIFSIAENLALFRKVKRLTKGGDGKSLEGTIVKLGKRVQELESHSIETANVLKSVDTRLSRSVQGVSVRRFDPFQNAGGQQSFSTALLNEQGDGIVISGIHARDGVRVYAKNVTKFASERELSDDERASIEDAKKKLT